MFKKEKFKALVHLVISLVADPSKLGAIKLNKIAWSVDGRAFKNYGKTLTGETYQKQDQGPVPRTMLPTLNSLVSEGKISVNDVQYYGKIKKQYESLKSPDEENFTSEDMKLIKSVVKEISENHTGQSVSITTHTVAWKIAKIGEIIPFSAYLVDDLQPLTKADINWIETRLADDRVNG